MPTTRSQKNANNIAAETLMSIHKDNDIIQDMITISYQEQENKRAKEELAKLKLIKEHTSNYNTLKMLVDIHTREMDRLELIISTLLSSVDK